MLIVADRVLESSTSTGIGSFTLDGARPGYIAFDDVMSNGDTCYYVIEAVDANGAPSGDWEVGLGTFNDTDTLVRTTPQASSNDDAAVDFAAGTKHVYLSATAAFLALKADAATVTAALSAKLVAANNLSDLDDAATARTNLGLGTAATLDEATAAQYRGNTADKVLSTDQVWSAAASVALTPGASVPVDLNSGINFTLAMGGDYQLATPTNGKDGQTGKIEITQDATGSRLLTFGTGYVFAGGTAPTLSTAASALDVLFYEVLSNGDVFVASQLDVKAAA